MKINVDTYLQLISEYLSGKISAKRFESIYLKKFIDETAEMAEEEYSILNGVFMDVEAFCDNPELFDKYSIDQNELKRRCKFAFEKLKAISDK